MLTFKWLNFKKIDPLYIAFVVIITCMGLTGLKASLDLKLFYTAEEALQFLNGLSPEQWQAYIYNEILDCLFLSTYSAILFLFASRAFPNSPWKWLSLIPGFLDLIETITILMLLLKVVASPPDWLGAVTCLKWTSGLVIVLALTFQHFSKKRVAHGN